MTRNMQMTFNRERFAKFWLFLYSFVVLIAAGGFLTLFFFVYTAISPKAFLALSKNYYDGLLYIAGFCTVILTPLLITYQNYQKKYEFPMWLLQLNRNIYGWFATLISFYVIYMLNKYDVNFKFLELMAAGFTIYLIYSFQNQLILDGYPAWKNFMTSANILAGIAKTGLAILILMTSFRTLAMLIVAVLVFDALVVFGRIRILSRTSPESQQSGRLLLTRYSLVFGARVIIGLFIPLVYALYQYMGQIQSFRFIAIFIIMGELLERYLFVQSAVPADEGFVHYEN